ncbi:MAG: deoxyribonuclease IV [Thermoplasmata archaeon HGW-Thermoplasmata-1]|nr:MAG: deoxyribonuclease IV [Thermoplasmata archaeon HGW-Thermoplasmata-1]
MGLIGAHVSIAGGVWKAPANGKALGCEAVQIFTKNQRRWDAKPLTDDDAALFLRNLRDSGIKSVIAHSSYLINLASPDKELLERSILSFIDEMHRCEMLEIRNLVFHPGSHVGSGVKKGLAAAAGSISECLDQTSGFKVKPTIEITAGQGSNLGCSFEQIAEIMGAIEDRSRIAVCYDTAHGFAAGYDIRTEESYGLTFGMFEDAIGLKYLECFHLNDTNETIGSNVDRHENLGGGQLGTTPFNLLVNDARFEKCPMILETPGGEGMYLKNLAILRSFRK